MTDEIEPGPSSARLRRRSESTRRLATLFRVLALGLPATVLVVATSASGDELSRALGVASPAALGLALRGALVVLALLPALGTSLALEALRRSARATHEGRGLTLGVARELRTAASWMLGSSLAALVVPSLAGLLLSIAAGKLSLMVHIDSGVVMPLVLAAALRLVGGLVVEGADLADEHAAII